jgi:pimeloyl-ACP methyl ester carboxylesterase
MGAPVNQPPVLLVHGFASSYEHNWVRHGWPDLLEDTGRAVIGVDLLGHGSAPAPAHSGAYSRVEDLVQESRVQFPVVDAIGFSAGATVLLTLLARYPGTFRRVVLMGIGDSAIAGQPAPDGVAAVSRSAAGQSIELLIGRAANPAALRAFLARERVPLSRDQLASITAAVHVVVGTDDAFGYPADELVRAIPGCTTSLIDRLDHFATPGDVRALDAALSFISS